MEPQQSQNSNNYDFIMNPQGQAPQKPGGLPGKVGGLDPFIQKIILLIGGAVVFIVIATVAVNFIFGGKTNLDDLVSITQTEQEVVRVSTTTKATDQAVKDAAINTQLAVKSQQQAWLNFLSENGRKVGNEELALKKSAATDQKLTTAEKSGTFDDALAKEVRSKLDAYSNQLRQAFQGTTNQTERALLQKHFDEVQLLLKQWPSS